MLTLNVLTVSAMISYTEVTKTRSMRCVLMDTVRLATYVIDILRSS